MERTQTGERSFRVQKYGTPDFARTEFELDDVLTVSVGTQVLDGGNAAWLDA